MNTIKIMLCLLMCVLAVVVMPARLDAIGLKPKPARLMDEAFQKVDAADSSIENNDVAKGVALYREALDSFNAIARDYPLWNPELLDLKRSYCEHQLSMALELSGDTEVSVPKPAPMPSPGDAPLPGPDDDLPVENLSPIPPVQAANPADLATKEDLLEIIEDLQQQLKAKNSPKGDRALVEEYNKLSREHNELQGEHTQLELRYENLKKERDSLSEDSSLSGKDKRKMKKQVEDLTKNGVQLLNDKKELQRELAILKAEKDELKAMLADGSSSAFSSGKVAAANPIGPPSPTDTFNTPPSATTAPAVSSRPAPASGSDPLLFPSLAGKYENAPPAITPSRPAPASPQIVTPEQSKLKELIKAGKFDEAIRRADQYLSMAPDDSQLLLMKGMAACRAGQFDSAVDALQRLTASVPAHENGWVLLGTAYMAKKNTWKASESFHRALAINPNSPEANYNMAQILVSVDDFSAARQCYMKCLQAGGRRDAALEKQLNR